MQNNATVVLVLLESRNVAVKNLLFFKERLRLPPQRHQKIASAECLQTRVRIHRATAVTNGVAR